MVDTISKLKGIFGYVAPDWKDPWMKIFHSSGLSTVTGGGKINNGTEIIPLVKFYESVEVGEYLFETEEMGIHEDPNDGRAEILFPVYNEFGELTGKPYPMDFDARIYDLHEVDDDKIVIFYETGRQYNYEIYYQSIFLQKFNFGFLELDKGSSSILSEVNDRSSSTNPLSTYPNPTKTNRSVFVDISNINESVEHVELTSLSGQKAQIERFSVNKDQLIFKTPNVQTGFYIVSIHTSKGKYSTKIIIE